MNLFIKQLLKLAASLIKLPKDVFLLLKLEVF